MTRNEMKALKAEVKSFVAMRYGTTIHWRDPPANRVCTISYNGTSRGSLAYVRDGRDRIFVHVINWAERGLY